MKLFVAAAIVFCSTAAFGDSLNNCTGLICGTWQTTKDHGHEIYRAATAKNQAVISISNSSGEDVTIQLDQSGNHVLYNNQTTTVVGYVIRINEGLIADGSYKIIEIK